MNTIHSPEIKLGSFVTMPSVPGIGEVIGFGEFVGEVKVKFPYQKTPYSFQDKYLTISKYSQPQLDKIRAAAPEMYDMLVAFKNGTPPKYEDMIALINRINP